MNSPYILSMILLRGVFLNRVLYVSEMVPYTVPRRGSCADVWDGRSKVV